MSFKNKDYHSTQSEVAKGAQYREAALRVKVGRSDEQMIEQGFELDEMTNKDGVSLQKILLYPGDKKMPLLTEERLAEMQKEKLRPHDAIEDALRQNPYASRYDQWRAHAPRWLRKLDAYMRDYMHSHKAFQEAQNLSPDILNHICKPVVAIGTQADVTYHADLFLFSTILWNWNCPVKDLRSRKAQREAKPCTGTAKMTWSSQLTCVETSTAK